MNPMNGTNVERIFQRLIGKGPHDKPGDTSMRFFKHGEVLAISLPESLRKKLSIAENDEFEFSENPDGSLKLLRKNPFTPAPKTTKGIGTSALPDTTMPWSQKPNAPGKAPGPLTSSIKTTVTASSTAQISKPTSLADTGTELDRFGYLVLDSEMDAKNFSHRFESQIKAGDIKGIRGFDKKFYLASRAYMEAFADKLLVSLKEPKTVPDLASLTKQPQEGILTLLYLLKEEGEIIEKKRGLFVRVL